MMKLKPNCLITRRPIRLITGLRSVFFYNKPWGDLPIALYEHGYKAELLHLPFSNPELRKTVFNKYDQPTHYIIDLPTYLELNIQPNNSPQSTFTVISSKEKINSINQKTENLFFFDPKYKTWNLGYFLHQKWCASRSIQTSPPDNLFLNADLKTYYRFIDHCVALAELDFQLET